MKRGTASIDARWDEPEPCAMQAVLARASLGRVLRVVARVVRAVFAVAVVAALGCQSGASLGATCRRASDCTGALVCTLGACRAACRVSRDCTLGQRCLVEPTTGVTACSVAQLDDCMAHPCPNGLTCSAGTCVNACGDVVACPDGNCVGNVCIATPIDAGVSLDAPVADAHDAAPSCHGPSCDPVVHLAMGDDRVLAITASGALWGWGHTENGALGDGATAHGNCATCSPTPVRALAPDGTPIADVIDASTGSYFSCAVRRDGTVVCWGRNYFGQRGDGGPDGDLMGHVVIDATMAPLSGVTRVRSGDTYSCAIRGANAEVWCWGVGGAGQLGTAMMVDSHVATLASELGTGVRDLAINSAHTLALASDGSIRGVGDDSCDVLAEATPSAQVLHANPGPLTAVTALATSSWNACALSGGALSCWGLVGAVLGSPMGMTFPTCSLCPSSCTAMPIAIPQPATHPITHLSGHGDGTYFGTSDDGALYVWGGAFGEPYASVPMPTLVPLSAPVSEAHVGGGAACLLTSSGDVLCWGKNDQGQLAQGFVSTTDIMVPSPIPVVWP
jgi:alpha-tubulin suppressor-like RCC1 family protein